MTPPLEEASASLTQLATYLAARREALLNNWRTACESDAGLKGVKSLSREEFNNKVPFMLNAFQQRLRGQQEDDQVGLLAAEHGLHRWQKGYALAELSAEMIHLSNILLGELRLCWQLYSAIDKQTMATAYEYVATFSNQISVGSLEQYDILQRTAASSRVEALEKTLAQLNQLSQQRRDLLHQSSHDLRGASASLPGRLRC